MGGEDQKGRVCDFCGEATALLYCRADTAKLCMACDREVHSTNQLFTKHTRWLLCDTCGSSPVSIFCYTDNTVLCQNCDWEAHKPGPYSSGLHDRRPLDGFTGCPSVTELLAILGFEDVDKKALFLHGDDDSDEVNCLGYNSNFSNSGDGDGDFGLLDVLAWDCPSIVSVDELPGSNDSIYGHNFQAMEVPPLPKNRNVVCGRHKEELLHQLCEMLKSEPDSSSCDEGCLDSLIEFQSIVPGSNRQKDAGLEKNVAPTSVPSYEVNAFQWCSNAGEATGEGFPSTLVGSYAETNHLVPEKDSDVGDGSANLCSSGHEGQSNHPLITKNFEFLPNVSVRELNSQERDSAISRYKEKKKTRRYEKQIRYESRKVRAESRTRIKGRFAKMGQREPATK